jgi:hypothetical protein
MLVALVTFTVDGTTADASGVAARFHSASTPCAKQAGAAATSKVAMRYCVFPNIGFMVVLRFLFLSLNLSFYSFCRFLSKARQSPSDRKALTDVAITAPSRVRA